MVCIQLTTVSIHELNIGPSNPNLSETLSKNIDYVVDGDPEKREMTTIEQGFMILESLRRNGVDVKTLEHLKIGFLDRDKRKSKEKFQFKPEEKRIGQVQRKIRDVLGMEVLLKLDLKMSRGKVNIFRGV